MNASVVIRTKDEAERLRLTLASLMRQTRRAEIVVVNDGSTDATSVVLGDASSQMELRVVTHAAVRGRSPASNAGAREAGGDVVIFLDGDTLAGPDFVARHLAVHELDAGVIGRGETLHIRRANVEHVSREAILHDFGRIDALAAPGIYPGAAARRLYELEMDALHRQPAARVLWAAASGSNLSVSRAAFLETGGFLEDLDLNEHRELALRLCKNGLRMRPVDGARTYHLITGPRRDPLLERDWETVFYRAHPMPEVKQLSVLFAALAEGRHVESLAELERTTSRC
jgi:glycosyltransferase involved in cell wall biosynthesis